MDRKTFSPLHVNNLGIDNLYGIIKTTIEISEPAETALSDLSKAALTELTDVNAELEKRMKKTLSSALTPELLEVNGERNKFFAEIKRFVSTADKSSMEALKKPGSILRTFLKPYWDTEAEPLNTITSIYEEILDRYHADENLEKAAETLGITTLITELESINADYDRLYKERNTVVSGKTGNSASDMKDDAVQAYEQYCTVIEQNVNLVPNAQLEQLFADMDGLRRKYALIKPKPRKKKEQE